MIARYVDVGAVLSIKVAHIETVRRPLIDIDSFVFGDLIASVLLARTASFCDVVRHTVLSK